MIARCYTVATLAAEWECSEGAIRKLIGEGRIGHFRIGALIRIPAEEARRFECQNIPSNDSAAATPSSIETQPEPATANDFEPPTVLGLKRRLGGAGAQGGTVLHGRWGE